MDEIEALHEEVTACRRCPRLVAWREDVARVKRASFAAEQYWGRPVPGFGDPRAGVFVVGLAPAAHGGNRTGRVFTGDRSGDWLWAAIWRAGLCNQPESTSRQDGLVAYGLYVSAVVKCAPPDNKPLPQERDNCLPYLQREIQLQPAAKVFLALGGFAYEVCARLFGLRPRPKFAHGLEVPTPDGRWVVCSYHPSQQNTFTGRLTEEMLDSVLARCRELAR
ncbi:MAG TPA: uracil-DNA glycosylase [Acidimicrobiales bacterium]|nr:uracil-DNA glycosylase [Acidimicrobiales bacterium]